MASLPHHPLIEQFFSGRLSSTDGALLHLALEAGVVDFARLTPRETHRYRCAVETCRNIARGVGRSANLCALHAREASRTARRERNRRYRAARGPRKTEMPSDPFANPAPDAVIVR